jgi:Ni,Fe-hydrogenase III large subunit/Ni,Fe-hydrogenase III component G
MSEHERTTGLNGDGVALLPGNDRVQIERVETEQLASLSHELWTEHGARLADLFAEDTPEGRLVLRSVYALDAESRYLVLEGEVDGERFPPLSDLDPAAFVEECEIYEQYGVRPDNRKRLNRVLVPPHHADRFPRLGRREGRRLARDYEPHVVSGEAFEFPFGPVRVAGWESLYMGLVTTGEEVLDLYLFHWHKHRGIERRLTGLDVDRATFFVERADGLSSVGDTIAFCRAVEMATGTEVPRAAAHSRAVALELERIYNHAAAIAAMCQSTGLSVGQARSEIVLEQLLRLNLAAFGHRYLFDVVSPGGVRRMPSADQVRSLLPPVLDEFCYVVDALLITNSHVDRLEATGVVAAEDAHRLSLVGPVARASGQAIDVRRDHPTGVGDEPAPTIATQPAGDVLARMRVMVAEVEESARLVDAHLDDLDPAHPACQPVGPGPGAGLGWAESPRGEALAWVSLDGDGRIDRARLRPASVRNWRAFDDAARAQNVFTDIPIIEASFWLTVAGFAR